MKKFFRILHKYLSIPVGIIISITCLTGAILVFQEEILEAVNPEHYFVKEKGQAPIPLQELVPMVNRQLNDNTVVNVKIPADTKRTYTMTLKEGFRVSAFVDPYTGKITGYYKTQESPFHVVMRIHRWLMDGSRTAGKYAVGISTLLFVFILISGFMLWFPREFRKSRFKIQFKKGRRRLLFDLHNVLGAYACLILLICALSGLMWSFSWYRSGVFAMFGAEAPQERGHAGRAREERSQPGEERQGRNNGNDKQNRQTDISCWQMVADDLKKKNPENEYIRIEDGKAVVHQKNMITSRASDEYVFEKETGKILKTILYAAQPKASKIWGWAYSLHVGNYWGIWSKIITFMASLIGASLPLTGYYLWLKKRKSKKNRIERK